MFSAALSALEPSCSRTTTAMSRRKITIRELAEEQLADLDAGGRCAPILARRIRAALP
jgi:hypothetical protein